MPAPAGLPLTQYAAAFPALPCWAFRFRASGTLLRALPLWFSASGRLFRESPQYLARMSRMAGYAQRGQVLGEVSGGRGGLRPWTRIANTASSFCGPDLLAGLRELGRQLHHFPSLLVA
jgi:hypothetical protein